MDQHPNREPGRTPQPEGAQPGSPPLDGGPQGPGPPARPETPRQGAGYDAWPPEHAQQPPPLYSQQTPTEGARTVQFGQPEQPLPGAPPYPTPNKTRRQSLPPWAWVLGGLGLLSCMLCAGMGVLGGNLVGWFVQEISQPTAVATEYALALRAHDFEQAHSHFSTELARRYSQEELEASWLALEERGEITGSNNESVHLENNEATVGWVITARRARYETKLTLREVGNVWKITGGDPGPLPQP